MISTLIALATIGSSQGDQPQLGIEEFSGVLSPEIHLSLSRRLSPLDPPKLSPKQKWEFPWSTIVSTKRIEEAGLETRFRIYSQEASSDQPFATRVARAAMRLWEFNIENLKLDHAYGYNHRIIDIYLCLEGTPGSQQLFGEDTENLRTEKVNTIYMYDIDGLSNPLELLREMCHEYGHATLPSVGGFSAPENWASGSLGEFLYMRWFRDSLQSGLLSPADAAGVEPRKLDLWVKKKVDPLTLAAATQGPRLSLLKKATKEAYEGYLSVALYAESILPPMVFGRSLVLIGSTKAQDYPGAVVAAVMEAKPFIINLPSILVGKTIWIPAGKAKIVNANVLMESKGWVKVTPKGAKIKVFPPQSSR